MSNGIECKRLGVKESELEFNDVYSDKGIARLMTDEHQYANGCSSASMVGYIQDMDPDAVFDEGIMFAANRSIPSLVKAAMGAMGWADKSVNPTFATALEPHIRIR